MRVNTDTFACAELPVFLEKTEILKDWISALTYEQQKALWICSDKIARQNTERFAHMDLRRNLTPAILSYDGIQYTYMAPAVFEDGRPIEGSRIQRWLEEIIEESGLPKVVFHSIRHSSITYKLKLNGGDIKAVQGDSGHSQVKMVTDVYSHIIDEDRRKNAQRFEEEFYSGTSGVSGKPDNDSTDAAELFRKVASDPKMLELLKALADSIK